MWVIVGMAFGILCYELWKWKPDIFGPPQDEDIIDNADLYMLIEQKENQDSKDSSL